MASGVFYEREEVRNILKNTLKRIHVHQTHLCCLINYVFKMSCKSLPLRGWSQIRLRYQSSLGKTIDELQKIPSSYDYLLKNWQPLDKKQKQSKKKYKKQKKANWFTKNRANFLQFISVKRTPGLQNRSKRVRTLVALLRSPSGKYPWERYNPPLILQGMG